MHSVLENDSEVIDDGKIINDMINQGIGFTPSEIFKNLVKNYRFAEKLYGKTFLRKITGMGIEQLKRNIRFPEFKKELKKKIEEKHKELKKKKLLNQNDNPTEEGYNLATLILYTQELDNLSAKGIGEKILKKKSSHGDEIGTKHYKRDDIYKNISVHKSINLAIRRGHKELMAQDLIVNDKVSKGKINIIYAIDASGSMKGKKIEMAKKSGIALAFKAISNKDKVGIVVFSSEIIKKVPPTNDFGYLLNEIGKIKSKSETNLLIAIKESTSLFPDNKSTKHLMLLTDAMPTTGDDPQKEALEAVSAAYNHGITISLIGIKLDKKGIEFAKKVVEIGKGKLYKVEDVKELDSIVLQDYYDLD